MERPTEIQLAAAGAVMRKFAQQTRGTAADNQTRHAVFSVMACLGGPGVPAVEYEHEIAEVTDKSLVLENPVTLSTDKQSFVIGPNPYGIPEGEYDKVTYDAEDEAPARYKPKTKENVAKVAEASTEADADEADDEALTYETLSEYTKADLVENFNASMGQNKDSMIAEILEKQKASADTAEGEDD